MKKLFLIALALVVVQFGCSRQQPLAPKIQQTPVVRLAKPAAKRSPLGLAVVVVTAIQDSIPVEGLEVAFSRSISGRAPAYKWTSSRYTDKKGQVEIEIVDEAIGNVYFQQLGKSRVTGYYLARATDPVSGKVIGQWRNIPINDGQKRDLILEIGKQARLGPSLELAEGQDKPIAFENLREASSLRVQKSGTAVFKDAPSWESFWREHINVFNDAGPLPVPVIDFKKHILIAVFWGGELHSGCFVPVEAIESVSREGARIKVHVGRLPSLGPCRAVVHPLQVIKIDRSDLPVVFTGEVPVDRGS